MRKFYTLSCSPSLLSYLLFLACSLLVSVSTSAQGSGTALSYNATPVNPVNSFPNNEYLQMPTGVVQSLNQSFTIEAWVYWRGKYDNAVATSDQYQRIFDFGMSGDPVTQPWMFLTPYSTFGGGNGVQFAISTNGLTSPQYIISASPLTTNQWHHIAVTLDNATNTATIYVDGTSVASGIITLRPDDLGATNQNWLGKSQFNSNAPFNGIIEEFRISNTVRYTSAFTPATIPFTTDGNTVLLYHFSEGSGQTTADASANAFHATLGFSTALEEDLDPDWVGNSILPVKMEQFTVQRDGSAAMLNWTASSTGEDGEFVLERSADGRNFQKIGIVDIGSQAGSFAYSFRDASPYRGKNYYRIRIQEMNAATVYSGIIWLDMSGRDVYTIHPTAAPSNLFVNIPQATRLSIFNSSGMLVQTMQLAASQSISIQQLPKGMYHLQFQGAGKTVRFIKL